ncbi:flagellar hook-associated protein FlgK [Anaerosalibacter sp. Marseille-P3206]|uniref:flagellar hook-associated protein FlgK n=1 Tax=Anaerosalibacter sp. Marseille-P3206 TaxID=1871005 RepID=UPI000985CA83|nr:flagellar hook-associated protein FlgK [Anaerosalibacter sp. Marseille-P3206]
MFGFNTAVSGLLASQRALYITNHNIQNMTTEGYSRQVAKQRATNPMNLPGIGFLGTGTEIYDVVRIRDSYVDFKYWNENAPKGEWEVKKEKLMEIEKLFGEPSNSSFRQYLDDFFTSINELSKNPSDFSYRQPVKEASLALTKHINETAKRLENLRKDTMFSIDTKVKQANDIAYQISSLNKQIYSLEIDGKSANDLRDKRELLVDNLSKIANVKVDESPEGKYRVSISGVSIVDHDYVSEIEYKREDPTNADSKRILQWANGGKLNLKGGELKGLIELVDENGEKGSYRGIPFYQEKLDEFAREFAKRINEVHREGYGYKKEEKNKLFFAVDEATGTIPEKTGMTDEEYKKELNKYYEQFNATNLTISKDILEDVGNIAVAKDNGNNVEDNTNMLEILALREDKNFFSEGMSKGTPDDFIKSLLSNLAVDSMQAQRMDSTQQLIINNIVKRRQSESGVSENEEMGNIVKFQHVYTASARMITTLDTILDVTINRLGLVGR